MPDQPKIALISLGCPKAVVDSEKILGQVAESGGLICADVDDADIFVINTCTFIEEATSESLDVIHEALERKRAGKCQAVIVCGCLAQLRGEALAREIPEVDAWVGVDEEHRIAEICQSVTRTGSKRCGSLHLERTRDPLAAHDARLRMTPRHYAYLKISEGCDNVCSFCIIPRIRGRHRSKPREVVINEARELVQDGARELILVAQDTTDYGRDLYGKRELAGLLRDLSAVDGVRWLRLLYAFPAHFDDRMLGELADNPRICHYLDLPIQHISDRLLRQMGRETGRKETEALVRKLRDRIPDVILRTSIIVGFPGETDQEFEELVDFLKETRFDRLGAFRYSHEQGTGAWRLSGQVAQDIATQRLKRVMEVQQGIAFEKARGMVGRGLEVLIDRRLQGKRRLWEGRSYGEAPEIDGIITVLGRNLKPGTFHECRVIGAEGYDLIATPVDPRHSSPDLDAGASEFKIRRRPVAPRPRRL
jgi:ribosomal protein S12 methylthiotransferase